MQQPVDAYLALGSNLQQPAQQLQHALSALSMLPKSCLVKVSSFYTNPPLGPPDQPDFVNAVARLHTALKATTLLEHLQSIEQQQGKSVKRHWGERIIDIDILLYSDLTINTPQLTLPHPRLTQRNFVVFPLLEITPQLCLPNGIKLSEVALGLSSENLLPLKKM